MNAVEIESAVSDLAARPFDPSEFPFQFLAAFDKKETTLKRLRKGDSNKSDVPDGVLLQSNIHIGLPGGPDAGDARPAEDQPEDGGGEGKVRAGDRWGGTGS
jgi:hypothetical protein